MLQFSVSQRKKKTKKKKQEAEAYSETAGANVFIYLYPTEKFVLFKTNLCSRGSRLSKKADGRGEHNTTRRTEPLALAELVHRHDSPLRLYLISPSPPFLVHIEAPLCWFLAPGPFRMQRRGPYEGLSAALRAKQRRWRYQEAARRLSARIGPR